MTCDVPWTTQHHILQSQNWEGGRVVSLPGQFLILKTCEVSLTQAEWVSVTVFLWSYIPDIAITVASFWCPISQPPAQRPPAVRSRLSSKNCIFLEKPFLFLIRILVNKNCIATDLEIVLFSFLQQNSRENSNSFWKVGGRWRES